MGGVCAYVCVYVVSRDASCHNSVFWKQYPLKNIPKNGINQGLEERNS